MLLRSLRQGPVVVPSCYMSCSAQAHCTAVCERSDSRRRVRAVCKQQATTHDTTFYSTVQYVVGGGVRKNRHALGVHRYGVQPMFQILKETTPPRVAAGLAMHCTESNQRSDRTGPLTVLIHDYNTFYGTAQYSSIWTGRFCSTVTCK